MILGPAGVRGAAALLLSLTLTTACTLSTERVERDTGTLSEAVVGGTKASPDQIRSTVAIADVDYHQLCSGTLIAPSVVLTAAHCVVLQDPQTGTVTDELIPEYFRVVGGVVDLDAPSRETANVRRLIRHAGFPGSTPTADGLGRRDDLALLFLEKPLTTLPPAPVAGAPNLDELVPGTPLEIAGYGSTDSPGEGSSALYVAETPYQSRNAVEFVAGSDRNADTCGGDSGGPVYWRVGARAALLGVTSRGVSHDSPCGAGGIYTWLPAYTSWLRANTDGEVRPSDEPSGCALGRRGTRRSASLVGLLALLALVSRRVQGRNN